MVLLCVRDCHRAAVVSCNADSDANFDGIYALYSDAIAIANTDFDSIYALYSDANAIANTDFDGIHAVCASADRAGD